MSTMYYTYPAHVPVGQTHSKGRDQGYHFTWTIYPMELLNVCLNNPTQFISEYAQVMPFEQFREIVHKAASQSFEEGIE